MTETNNAPGRLSIILFMLYLGSLVVEGPLRYGLSLLGAQSIIYLRDFAIFVFAVFATFFSVNYCREKLKLVSIVCISVLALHSIWGVFHLQSLPQVVFGIKLFVPFIFGVVCYDGFVKYLDIYWRYFVVFLLIASLGLIANYYIVMPWAGMSYEVGGVAIRGVKDWYAGDIRRLYGFGRASSTVAVQLLIFWALSIYYIKNNWIKLVLTAITVVAMVLTTTKGIWFAWIVIVFYLFLACIFQQSKAIKTAYVSLFGWLVVIIPITLLLFEVKAGGLDGIWRFAFSSFVDRSENMWPSVVSLLSSENMLLLGRGVGGAGTAQIYFEPAKYNPADNFFMYWWIIFGLLAVVYYLPVVIATYFLDYRSDAPPHEKFFVLLAIGFFVYGLTTYVFEGGEFACFGGILFGRLFSGARHMPFSQVAQLTRVPRKLKNYI